MSAFGVIEGKQVVLNGRIITSEDVTREGNRGFSYAKFYKRVLDAADIGDIINPRTLIRPAFALGAKGTREKITADLVFAFNRSHTQTRRRRNQEGKGYVYEKLK